jgi:hypothetical protein
VSYVAGNESGKRGTGTSDSHTLPVRSRRSLTFCGADHISPCVTIEALPDMDLLDIVELYRVSSLCNLHEQFRWPWNRLVQVCQSWRYLVFGSPLCLDLCLRCTSETPVREMLDVWPPLPIELIQMGSPYDGKSVIAALEHRDCVRDLYVFSLTSSQLKQLVLKMQELLPALRHLQLSFPVRLFRRFPICS